MTNGSDKHITHRNAAFIRSTNRRNRVFLIILIAFAVSVFSFSFVHLAQETGRSVRAEPLQAEGLRP